MLMDSRDKGTNEWIRLVKSFSYACNGLKNAITKERNLQIHIGISILVIFLGFYLQLKVIDWMIIVMMIGGMLVFELINTAIERLVDLVTMEYHPLAKIVKDVSAAAVFVFAITAVVVGVLVFYPYLVNTMQ